MLAQVDCWFADVAAQLLYNSSDHETVCATGRASCFTGRS